MTDLLRPAEVAVLLGVSAKTVSRWADLGALPVIITVGGHRRFRRADVLALAAEMGLLPPGESS